MRHDPPLEAYGRVSNPERFAPLVERVRAVLDHLERTYDVSRLIVQEPVPGTEPMLSTVESTVLTPKITAAGSLAVAFTDFPGVVARFGRWLVERYPDCGCDACAETAEGEFERFERQLGALVEGRFREELTIPWLGRASLRHRWSDSAGGTGTSGRRLSRAEARTLLGDGPSRHSYAPWSRRSEETTSRWRAV